MTRKVISIIGYVFGLAFNVPHIVAAYQMIDTTTGLSKYYIIGMVCVIDFTILVLAINEDKEKRLGSVPTVTFAWIVFFINLYLYWIDPIQAGIFNNLWNLGNISTLFIKLIFAALPAYIIYYYSEMIAEVFKDFTKSDKDRLNELESISSQLELDSSRLDVISSVLAFNSEILGIIRVDGKKSELCGCGRLIVSGSNREKERVCECGNLIKW